MSMDTHAHPAESHEADSPRVTLEAAEQWPFPRHEYPLRVLWGLVWLTLWQLCWARISILRSTILRLFGAKIGRDVRIFRSVRIRRPWDLTLGDQCLIGPGVELYNLGPMHIGSQTVISQDAYICGGTHDYANPTFPLLRKKVVIEDCAWIAAGAFISPGITVHEGAIVGAKAVVTKDVPPWTIVAGNPARVIKRRIMKQAAD